MDRNTLLYDPDLSVRERAAYLLYSHIMLMILHKFIDHPAVKPLSRTTAHHKTTP